MNCPNCQHECPPEFRFCPKCGTALERTCASCGYQTPLDFAFCPKCGSDLCTPDQETPSEHTISPALEAALQRLVPGEYAERLRQAGGALTALECECTWWTRSWGQSLFTRNSVIPLKFSV
jgi:hypothetical protein